MKKTLTLIIILLCAESFAQINLNDGMSDSDLDKTTCTRESYWHYGKREWYHLSDHTICEPPVFDLENFVCPDGAVPARIRYPQSSYYRHLRSRSTRRFHHKPHNSYSYSSRHHDNSYNYRQDLEFIDRQRDFTAPPLTGLDKIICVTLY